MTTLRQRASFPIQTRDHDRFVRLAEPFRRQLKLHCYRMVGSVHEAEDLVQETYLRAWRSFASLEENASLRAWLYRIATNVCLDALIARKRARRILPDQYGPATQDMPQGRAVNDVAWLEPFSDKEMDDVADEAPNPEARFQSREAVQLAFIAAIQYLTPRQRAVLLLCDVLGWSGIESATLLGGTVGSIKSALQRARDTLDKHYRNGEPRVEPLPSADQQNLLQRYMRAWEGLDLDVFVALLKDDAIYTMPPVPQWYVGSTAIGAFFRWAWKAYESFRLVPTPANGQPGFAAYSRTGTGVWTAHSFHVLTIEDRKISRLTLFYQSDGPHLFDAFRLPTTLADHTGSLERSTPDN